ncbi:common central domain of tyrosinase-domain-containing protein [Lasiosphaeria miniovina]|uniref:tyrosinase n=1 Tax=Lasiosphaeria miniovina TaxID=1954250 RepID=A0AA40AAU4_9PEZI|nr:common central domain of tyrosinase-domain-containing protein [Lasiosphaeria miniovina]KAK0712469.1 common central domain of tyrosinase-domain-containing protein [Lasiosphaeria miniovina]
MVLPLRSTLPLSPSSPVTDKHGNPDYATYVITDNHAALSAHASIAAVDDGNSFWCFSTTDSNQVYRLRVDKQGVVAQPQLVPLDVTPVPSSPLAAVLVKDAAAKERIVIFYLLHYDNVKRTTHETNVFATTLTATTSPAADTWSLSGQVCLAPSYYAITGIKTGVTTTTVPLRLEADAWYLSSTTEHRLQRSLFLHALRRLQKRDPSKKLSFFQIGGIHGMPYKPWDEDTKPATPNEGYCTHDSLLFPCWHRPYMMLFEAMLHEIMIKELIPQLPKDERKDWTDAANTWRLPYWDWAEKKTRAGNDDPIYDVPLITQDPRIAVINLKDPKGADSEYYVDNPMYKFTMPHKKAMGEYGVHDIKEGKVDIPSKGTSRSDTFPTSPISQEWLETWIIGKVNNTVVATSLKDHSWYGKNMKDTDKVPIAEMVYRLYDPNYISTFTQFATTKFHSKDAPATWLNLEYIHNNIHNWTGGFDKYIGHMTEVPVAGFDPIFYMHHANVDRQFAIWQAINQKNTDSNWFQKPSEQLPDDGTWSIKAGATDTPVTPLAPFHKDTEGNYFTSNDIRNWLDWGYSYPELQPWLDKYKKDGKFDVDLYIDDIKKQLKTLYSPHEDDDDDDENTETDETDTETSQALAARMLVRSPGGGAPARRQRKKWSKDIIVNITYDRFAFGGAPYILHLFIGDKSVLDGYTDRLEEHQQHVGLVCTFTSAAPAGGEADSEGDGCGACKKKSAEGTKSRAQVPITGAMMARIPPRGSNHGELEISHGIYPFPAQELEKPRVEDYLEEYLHWRVRSVCISGFLFMSFASLSLLFFFSSVSFWY